MNKQNTKNRNDRMRITNYSTNVLICILFLNTNSAIFYIHMKFCVFMDLINEYVLCISTILLICVYLFNKFNKSITHKIVFINLVTHTSERIK